MICCTPAVPSKNEPVAVAADPIRMGLTWIHRRIRGFRATGETRHVPGAPGSWDLRYSLQKTEKSADLAHYFSRVAKFCVQNKETSSLKRSMSGLNRIFYWEIPQ